MCLTGSTSYSIKWLLVKVIVKNGIWRSRDNKEPPVLSQVPANKAARRIRGAQYGDEGYDGSKQR